MTQTITKMTWWGREDENDPENATIIEYGAEEPEQRFNSTRLLPHQDKPRWRFLGRTRDGEGSPLQL